MHYYAIQVKTRGEERFIRLFKSLYPEINVPFHFLKRSLPIRQRGKLRQSVHAVFPGYLFVEAEPEELLRNQWKFRNTNGFYRFLKSNQDICPLEGKDLELVLHFIYNVGPLAGLSRVFFNVDSRIVVTEGPLMGLEGRIIKVDKRKRRAKVRLNLYNNSFAIDFAYEMIRESQMS